LLNGGNAGFHDTVAEPVASSFFRPLAICPGKKTYNTIFFTGFHPKFFDYRHKTLAICIGPSIQIDQAG
jgi:hypothetical protein